MLLKGVDLTVKNSQRAPSQPHPFVPWFSPHVTAQERKEHDLSPALYSVVDLSMKWYSLRLLPLLYIQNAVTQFRKSRECVLKVR